MKRAVVLMVVLCMVIGALGAENHGFFGTPEGNWTLKNRRLYQNDTMAPRAKAWMEILQNGSMVYEFTLHYEGGGEDGHGGAGIHILSDSRVNGKSWGFGDSWLLWLNYDVSPQDKRIPAGLSVQLYKSSNHSEMEIVESISLAAYEPLFMVNLKEKIPMKVTYHANESRMVITLPFAGDKSWYIDLPGARNDAGHFVALRTNGVAMSFESPDVDL